MSGLAEIGARSSALLLVAFGMVGLLRWRAARIRHAVLATTLGMTLAVGAAVWAGPMWTIAVPIDAVTHAEPPAQRTSPPWLVDTGGPVAEDLPVAMTVSVDLALVWLIGIAVAAIHLLLRLTQLRRLTRRGTPVTEGAWRTVAERLEGSKRRAVRVLCVDRNDVLATCGARRPCILVPRHALQWPERRVEAVLRHELAHVDRQDWAVQIAASGIRALYWFNPLVWIACRRLRLEAERACDEAVVRQGLPVQEYAVHLIDVARACGSAAHRAPLVSMSRGSALRGRITTMLAVSPSHTSWRAVAVITLGLAVSGMASSTVRLGAAPQGVSGTVYDPSGGVVPGARVTLVGSASQPFEVETGPDGHFEIPPVPVGKYKLSIALPGFKRFEEAVDLERDASWSRTITLQLGEVQEEIRVTSARITAPRNAATPPEPVRVGGNVQPPRKVRDVKPIYPESMRADGVEGLVPLEAIIDTTGSVKSVRILTAAVHPELALAAADAVRQWKFDPTRLNGTPVEVVMNVSISFELER